MARRVKSRVARLPDMRALGEALSFAGIDPRTWVSFATVDPDEVTFDSSQGYLVPVTLQPSQVQCLAVCLLQTSGDGEGEHVPYVEGDTLLVALPLGMERSGVVVLGRVANDRAPPPAAVAGQDATLNNFAWRKQRAPHLEEYGDRWTVRQAASEALLSIDKAGTVTIRDGGKNALQLSSDVFAYQSNIPVGAPGNTTCSLQFDLAATRFTVQAGEATLALSSMASLPNPPMLNNSLLSVPGALQIASGGNVAAEHVATVEGTANFLYWFMVIYQTTFLELFAGMGAALALTLGPFGAGFGTAWLTAVGVVATGLNPAAMAGLLAGASTTASVTPQNPIVGGALFTALQAQALRPKQVPAVPPLGQTMPGLGAASTLAG